MRTVSPSFFGGDIPLLGNILASLGIDGDDEVIKGGNNRDSWVSRGAVDRISTSSPIKRSMSALPILSHPPPPSPPISTTPSSCPEEDDEAVFKSDLAHMLVWFLEDLTDAQKLTTALALLRKLGRDQIGMLVECLKEEGLYGEKGNGSHSRSSKSTNTPAIATTPVASYSPTNRSPSLTSVNSAGSNSDNIQPNGALFHHSVIAWLRSHRLHKYSDILKGYSPHDLLKMSEEELERAGVVALGARRKFLRLFAALRGEI